MTRKVVVTGLGMVTPLGHNATDTWDRLVAGCSGTGPITLFDASKHDCRVAGEVKNFEPTAYMSRKEAHRADRFTQFAFVAADEALRQSGLKITPHNAERVAVIIGTAIGGITTVVEQHETMLARGPGRVSPFLVPMMLPDMASGQLSIRLGARAVNYSLISACAAGADSLGESANVIRRGDADVVVAGGTEAAITGLAVAGFSAARALTHSGNNDPARASRPFDARRDGFVIAEGAGVLVLEAEDHARARGARPLAELAGYGATSDAFHITQPDESGEGAARAMRIAMAQAGLGPDDVDYVNAHGTSTPLNDRFETLAVKRVFGEQAYAVPVSSTKSAMGHMLGAAGAVEGALAVLAIQNGVIPPTINYEVPDPQCDLDYVPNVARSATVDTVMTNSLGFGGHNTSLVFRRYQPE